MSRIQTDATEQIEVLALDINNLPLTGLTDVLLSVRRISDDFYYDFDDDTFKNSAWTTRQQALAEVDSTNSPGEYSYDFDTSAVVNAIANDTYQARVDQDPGTDAKNFPQTGEIKVGQYVDNIDIPTSEIWDEALLDHVAADSMGFAMKLIKAFVYGRKKQQGTQFIIYDPDTDMPWITFNTRGEDGDPANIAIYDAERV